MIGLEFQLQQVAVGRQVGGNFGSGEAAEYRGSRLVTVFDSEEVVGRLQVEVVEGQVDPGARLGDDEPHAVEVVAVALGVVGRQHRAHGSREVGEAGDWIDRNAKTASVMIKNFILQSCDSLTEELCHHRIRCLFQCRATPAVCN